MKTKLLVFLVILVVLSIYVIGDRLIVQDITGRGLFNITNSGNAELAENLTATYTIVERYCFKNTNCSQYITYDTDTESIQIIYDGVERIKINSTNTILNPQ